MLSRFNPAVPRRWLFALGGFVWTAVGIVLSIRAIVWMSQFSFDRIFLVECLGVFIAVSGYSYGFSKIVEKNVKRIHGLPPRVCLFAFTAWRGYFMIIIMVCLGLTLRNSDIPKYYLSVPYTAMGVILLIGSLKFYGEFLAYAEIEI